MLCLARLWRSRLLCPRRTRSSCKCTSARFSAGRTRGVWPVARVEHAACRFNAAARHAPVGLAARDDTASMDSVLPDTDENDEEAMAAQVQTLSYSAPLATTTKPKKPYPSRPHAAGLRAVRQCSDDWSPPWKVFPLKAFRGSNYMFLKIQADWDDTDLFRELGRSYDKLRTVWRKWFSLRSVRYVNRVPHAGTCKLSLLTWSLVDPSPWSM